MSNESINHLLSFLVGGDRGGLKESVAEEELHYLYVFILGGSHLSQGITYILYILRGVVD